MNVPLANSRISMPKAVLFGLLFAAWMLPGLIGRDPWKADEAYSFGLILNVLETRDLVVPTLGSDPFMEKPPIFYLTSAAFAKVFSPPLALHEAARASCIFYMALTLISVALASRELNGKGTGWLAALLLMGSLGLMHTAHMLMTDVSLVTGYGLALYGLALGRRRPWAGGLLCGTGAGLAFLSKGLLGPGAIGVTLFLLPLFRSWRTRDWWRMVAAAGLAVVPWVVVWPLALYQRSPALFNEWFWTNNLGRFTGSNHLGPSASPFFYLYLLPGFAWPVFPLAIWAVWKERHVAFKEPNVQLPWFAFLVMLGVLTISRQGRSLYATPMLVPLAILAVRAITGLNERAAKILSGFSIAAVSTLALIAWFGWAAQFLGWPGAILTRIQSMVPGFVPIFQSAAFLAALLATIGWVLLVSRRPRQNGSVVVYWTSGVALLYLLGMTIWLPVTNGDMTYRRDFAGLRESLGEKPGVIGSKGLGEPQRAMVHYYAGIKPLREESRGKVDCRWMLLQGSEQVGKQPQPPDDSWRLVWRGRHHRELFHLYHRELQ
jgi:4-amino-4-deoxy-L-arabinose transferase-like glycosyltransferase